MGLVGGTAKVVGHVKQVLPTSPRKALIGAGMWHLR
jgi:hypothetical protein